MNTSIQFITDYCDFSNPNWVWMLVGMSRNKDNKIPDIEGEIYNVPEKFMRRLVIRRPEEIPQLYDELLLMGNSIGTTYRMYLSINSRDTVSTLFHFQQKLCEIGYGLSRQLPDALQLSKKISSLWKTELAQKRNKGTRRILLDIDENDEKLMEQLMQHINDNNIVCYACRKTVSGYAIVCEAHDARWTKQFKFKDREIDIKHDSLLFIEQWQGMS